MSKKEYDPDGLSAKVPGSKLDAGKPQVVEHFLQYFPRAIVEVTKVSTYGAEKYTTMGWASVRDGVKRYEEADLRHLLLRFIQGENDEDSGLLHRAQHAWNALASLEMYLREKEDNEKA